MMAFKEDTRRLQKRFTCLVAIIITVASIGYIAWSFVTQESIAEETALVEARTLNLQMQASWNYFEGIQDKVVFVEGGKENAISCAVTAKQIARDFTSEAEGYSIRYVRNNPRNPEDKPDEFEARALEVFEQTQEAEYYGISTRDDKRVFRYVSKLIIEESCLGCHGSPAGSRDKTGSFREGLALGELAGASSIIIPMESHRATAVQRAALTIAFFGALLLVTVLVVRRALKAWVIKPMEEANVRLEEDNAIKADFLTLMSHELKTPLSSIIAFTDIWQNSEVPHDKEEEFLVAEVRSNSDNLLGMLNNIIDMAKVDAGKYEVSFEEVDILDVIGAVKAVADPIAINKGIGLRFEFSPNTPIVFSDWEVLRKILTNLVGNALKFTEKGGVVTVSTRSEHGMPGLSVVISDTGCGIPRKDLDRVFQKFEQSTSSYSANEKGSGLGLSLSQGLAEMIGGRIAVESEVGRGSTFTLHIPIKPHDEGGCA